MQLQDFMAKAALSFGLTGRKNNPAVGGCAIARDVIGKQRWKSEYHQVLLRQSTQGNTSA